MTITKIDVSEQRGIRDYTLPKEVWIGWVSSASEAYNISIYSFLAPLLATRLFMHEASLSAVLFSYCLVFIASSLFYPLGAIYYGLIGDSQGRQKICIYSTLGLATATGCMGCIPLTIFGEATWIVFLLLICAQNFFSGGEYHGSIVFSLEHTNENKGGLMSSLSCLFAVFGLAAASGFATLSQVLESDLWIRACFLLGSAGGIISYLLKNQCRETPAFIAISKETSETAHSLSFIGLRWRKIIGIVLLLGLFIVIYSFTFLFLPLTSIGKSQFHNFNTFNSLIIYGICLVMAGVGADRIGVSRMIMLGAYMLAILIIPLCYLCRDLFFLQVALTVISCLIISPIHSWMLQQFKAQERCRCIFISSAVATSLFGGSTVPLCLLIFEKSGSLAACALYPFALAISFIIYQKREFT